MIYSHSRLSCFEQCPKKFELKYLLKVKVPEKQSIEAFMGGKVHETLEKLFVDLQHTKKNELKALLDYFEKVWKEDWRESILITKEGLTVEHYFELGKKCVANFYEKNHPFKVGVPIGIEKKITLDLNEDGKYKLTGRMDLLIQVGKNHFQVHDYKTYAKLPEQQKIDEDMQLAIYQMGVQKQFPEAKKIDLIWHYVVFQREGISHRSKKQLETLRKELIALIKKIEATEKFETKESGLCKYCSYEQVCPAWKHQEMLEKLPAKKYAVEEGVQLADKYAKLYAEKQELLEKIENQLEELKTEIFEYAKQHGFEVIQGTSHKLKIKTTEKLKFPGKGSEERSHLEALIRRHNLWTELSELDTTKLSHYLEEGKLPKTEEKELKKYAEKTETKTIYLSKIK